ncbi:MAG: methylthioribulose 1-phosphate dehydratase [Thermoplasmataceae archaeon]
MDQNTEFIGVELSRKTETFAALIDTATDFYRRGWLLGTSGNLSAVLRQDPFRIAITGSGIDKGHLSEDQIIEVDETLNVLSGNYKPSSESALHITLEKRLGCMAVFHTHSIWSTILSRKYVSGGGFEINGYEMLKGLNNVNTHDHSEWFPVIENSQDMVGLASRVEKLLEDNNDIHCFLLSGHGLYTWGSTIREARRHVEAIEFLLEVFAHSENSFRRS